MKRYYTLLLLIGLLFAMMMLYGCTSKEVTSAKVYIQQDDWAKAAEQLKVAVQLYPNDAEAHALLGEAYSRQGEFTKMNEHFEKSLAITPLFAERINFVREKNWVQNFNNGVAQVKNERYAEALALFKSCEIIDPKRTDSYKNASYVYIKMDSTDSAMDEYRKVLEYDPKDTKTMLQLGGLLYEKKQYDECAALMDKILELEPSNTDATSQKAFAFDSKGESDKAFEAYNDALKQSPNNPDILFNLGRLYYMRNDYLKAIEQFKNVLQTNPDDFESILNTGNAYLSIAEDYMKPLREGKELPDAKIKELKGNAIENYKAAIPFLEKTVTLKPEDPITWTNLGVAYINAGMKQKGEEAFKKSEELNK